MPNDRGWFAEEVQRTSEEMRHTPNADALLRYAETRAESQNRLEAAAYRERQSKTGKK